MKNLIHYIFIASLCLIAFACNKDFLSKTPELPSLTTTSEILISPGWDAKDYSIQIPEASNASFSIVQIPNWLRVSTLSGQFTNGVATINCSAFVNNDYSGTIGIYKSSIVLDINGFGNTVIPISYIVEGNPAIETGDCVINDFINSLPFVIKNNGNGILLWSVVEKPDWISFNESVPTSYPPSSTSFAIPPNGEMDFTLSYNILSLLPDSLSGRIVIASNDKNQSETVVPIQFNLGNPSFSTYTNQVDFGPTDNTQYLQIYNMAEGFLTWKISSCPEWLSVSGTMNYLLPHSALALQFNCDRSLMPNEWISQTIYLETNDPDNPSYAITVTVDNSSNDSGTQE